MSVIDLLNELGRNSYKLPLSRLRDLPVWPDLKNPLHLAMLIIDFDTEVTMNGMLGFLENPTGAYLGKTIEAFEIIGATEMVTVLRKIENCMAMHSITHEQLREPLHHGNEDEITSFAQLHGPHFDAFADEVCAIDDELYVYQRGAKSSPLPMLEEFVAKHASAIQTELNSIRG